MWQTIILNDYEIKDINDKVMLKVPKITIEVDTDSVKSIDGLKIFYTLISKEK